MKKCAKYKVRVREGERESEGERDLVALRHEKDVIHHTLSPLCLLRVRTLRNSIIEREREREEGRGRRRRE